MTFSIYAIQCTSMYLIYTSLLRMLKMGTILYVRSFCYLKFLTVFWKVYGDVYFENILRHKIYYNECQKPKKSGIVIYAFRVKSLFGLPSIFSVYFVLSHIIYYCKFSPRLISKILLLGFCQNWRLLWQ